MDRQTVEARLYSLSQQQQNRVIAILEEVGRLDGFDPDYYLYLDDAIDVVVGELSVGTYVYDLYHACEWERIPQAEFNINRILGV